jgi:hypothetical protein
MAISPVHRPKDPTIPAPLVHRAGDVFADVAIARVAAWEHSLHHVLAAVVLPDDIAHR